jgi:hypothetical protein
LPKGESDGGKDTEKYPSQKGLFHGWFLQKILAALVVESDLISYLRERFKAARGGLA